MAQITIQFPDGIGTRVNNLLARKWGYQSNISDPADLSGPLIPNPEGKTDFNKRKIVEFVKFQAVNQEVSEASLTASASQQTTSESELDITSA